MTARGGAGPLPRPGTARAVPGRGGKGASTARGASPPAEPPGGSGPAPALPPVPGPGPNGRSSPLSRGPAASSVSFGRGGGSAPAMEEAAICVARRSLPSRSGRWYCGACRPLPASLQTGPNHCAAGGGGGRIRAALSPHCGPTPRPSAGYHPQPAQEGAERSVRPSGVTSLRECGARYPGGPPALRRWAAPQPQVPLCGGALPSERRGVKLRRLVGERRAGRGTALCEKLPAEVGSLHLLGVFCWC